MDQNSNKCEVRVRTRVKDSIVGLDASPMHNGKDVFTDYQPKTSNSILRWNLLWTVFVLLAPYPLWLSFINCTLSYEVTIILNVLLSLNFTYATVLCWRYMWRMLTCFSTNYCTSPTNASSDSISHIVIMPTYKEPVELLLETIQSVAAQTVASSIVMVVGMEEKTPEIEQKKQIIRDSFGESFKSLIFSVHPYGKVGEIAGACSNRNYAARTAVRHMINHDQLRIDPYTNEIDLEHTTVTVCDADTSFFHRYFENLEHSFLSESEQTRHEVCWQSPLFYNIGLDKRWFFTRVMGILRSFFMIGFLIGCDINTMSIYSMSLRLLVESQFFHPGYQMDDIIYTLSAMKATGKRIRIRSLDVPTLSGPTSGINIGEEIREWVVQATRWTIGAAEVFHYFFVKLLKRNYFVPGIMYFWWFVYYYSIVLCISGLVQISTLVVQMISFVLPSVGITQCRPFSSWLGLSESFPYSWILPSLTLFNYFTVFFTSFFMDALVRQLLSLNEHITPIRNVLHFLSCQFVMWMYCLVEYKAILTVSIFGKKVCGHKPSQKHALVKGEVGAPQVVQEPEQVNKL